jgi:hypothetical protein
MVMTPKLKLTIDIKADIENAKWFVRHGEFVDSFLPLNFQYITSKKFSLPERNKIIAEYTKHIHALHEKEIVKGVKDIRKQWSLIEGRFYKIVDEIFHEYPWPKGKYIGYASIYLMFPRNINEKTFYFPYSRDKWNPLRTIAHEMLHFMFFDYIKKKYGISENDECRGKSPKYVWQVSETFNTVIENWKPYRDIFGTKERRKPYPGCEKMFNAMTKQWDKKRDIESFLDKWLEKKNLK